MPLLFPTKQVIIRVSTGLILSSLGLFSFFFLVSFLLSFYFFFPKACAVGKVEDGHVWSGKFLHFVEIEIPRSVLLLLFIFLLFFIIIFGVIYVH